MNDFKLYELSIVGADEYYLSDDVWGLLNDPYMKNGYVWAEDVYQRKSVRDWDEARAQRILVANMALEGVEKISPSKRELEDWSNVKGSALFFRAMNHYQLAQLFCKPYNAQMAKVDLGIPLRLDSDITLKIGRGNLQGVYDQIIADLELALDFLPEKPLVKYRPSLPATYALLARVYLQMADYKNAGFYANKALEISDELIDFNMIDIDSRSPFPFDPELNPEILFFSNIPNIAIMSPSRFNVDKNLWNSFEDDDLRKFIYFQKHISGRIVLKSTYYGAAICFTGLATDELLLIRSECYARENNISLALKLEYFIEQSI